MSDITRAEAISELLEMKLDAWTDTRQMKALDMAINLLEKYPDIKEAYNRGYEAGVKATNVDCGVVWEERIEDIKAEIDDLDVSDLGKMGIITAIFGIIDKHIGKESIDADSD